MKRKIFLILIFISFILVSGCNSQSKTIPDDLKNVTFNQQLSVTYEDSDKYIVEIEFENTSNYDFSPTLVSIQPQIRYVKDGVDTSEVHPIYLRAEQIDLGSEKYKYKVAIPKKIFDVYDRMNKERVMVTIEGMFTKENRIILLVSKGHDAELVKQQPSPDSPQQQVVNNEVMPADIVAALNANDSGEENSKYNKILATVELPRSLGISIPNIDMTKVHDTHPLQQLQIERLKSNGFSDKEIATMDVGDYKNIEKTWLLTPEMIKNIKNIYPTLAHIDLSKWKYEDFLAFSIEADKKTYAPTIEQASAIKARNITLEDARILLKSFHSYDTILKENDDILKDYLERYYKFTIDYIKQLTELSENTK